MADESSGSFYRKTNRDANKFIDTRRPARRRAVRVSPRVHRLCPPFYAHSSFVGADNDQLLLLLLHWLHFHEYVYTFSFFFFPFLFSRQLAHENDEMMLARWKIDNEQMFDGNN